MKAKKPNGSFVGVAVRGNQTGRKRKLPAGAAAPHAPRARPFLVQTLPLRSRGGGR